MEEQNVRDFETEVRSLYEQRPELKDGLLPEEVVRDCVAGQSLRDAYDAYAGRQDAERLRKENRILRQNAATAARAPVRGVTGGGTPKAEPDDPFLRGFNTRW